MKPLKLFSFIGFIAVALLTVLPSESAAQMYLHPIKLYVVKVETNGSVKLLWTSPKISSVDKYYILRAKMPDTSSYAVVDSTKDTVKTVYAPLEIGPAATYVFVIAARLTDGSYIKSNPGFALVPGIPMTNAFKISAKVDPLTNKVTINWAVPEYLTLSHYLLYRAIHPDGMNYVKVDSTTDSSFTNFPPVVSGLKKAYTYYVLAVPLTGQPLRSNIVMVSVTGSSQTDILRFTSIPMINAQIDKPYSYDVDAVSSDPAAVITYSLDRRPESMKIDPSSGLITWAPLFKGWFSVTVMVSSTKGGRAVQEYQLTVSGGNGIIQGHVSDTTGKSLSPVMIEAFKRDANACFRYNTYTDKNGDYRLTKLDPGKYTIEATPLISNLSGQWYQGKKNADQADIIVVQDSSLSIAKADFVLRYRDIAAKILTVRGKIIDTVGLPLNEKLTRVVFVRAEFALNSSILLRDSVSIDNFKKFFMFDSTLDFRLEGGSRHVFPANVDRFGNYSLSLPQGNYIAFARSPGYSVEFFKETEDFLSASIMTLVKDSIGIDFTLAPLPPIALGEISGAVLDTVKNIGVRARMMAIRDRWKYNDAYKISRSYICDTDSLGKFTVANLLPGYYIVLAFPVGNYAPAFYTSGVPSLGWMKATRIYINGNSVSDVDIYSQPMNRADGGVTAVGGHVGTITQAPISGAIIFALDVLGNIAGYGLTDNRGNYSIVGLAPGTYSVAADKLGYNSSGVITARPTYDLTGRAVGADASFTLTDATTGIATARSSVLSGFALIQNYPNPFNPSTIISYSLPASLNVTLKVYNSIGQQVAVLVQGRQDAGSYSITFDASHLSTGVYLYQLRAGSAIETKKMILSK